MFMDTGFITSDDLEKRMGDLRTGLSQAEILEMIRETDGSGSGNVTLEGMVV